VKVHKHLGDRVGKDIFILSISIDPEVDTPERLKQYAKIHGCPSRGWYWLTGDYDEIDRLRRSLGVYDLDPVIDADRTQHAGLVTFGDDRGDRWAALPALMDDQQLTESILRLTRDRRLNKGD